ncbi:HNH endonuclease [Archangium sp.]|uniref:HNH endonuclease n=1 Tax=Archangium sp. TaxID=1872627 RepID=UPI002D5A7639|nr:HNH endonuclease [Archangium sp.]HYO52633.1 HNH endonuclease [Archangium sp.]
MILPYIVLLLALPVAGAAPPQSVVAPNPARLFDGWEHPVLAGGRPRPRSNKAPTGDTPSVKQDGAASTGTSAPPTSSSNSLPSPGVTRHTPQLLEGGRKILPFEQTRQPASPIPNKGWDRAGKTIKSPDGKTTVRFDKNGFPEFDSLFDARLDDRHIGSGNPKAHFRSANESLYRSIQQNPHMADKLGLSKEDVHNLQSSDAPPFGYTWHHHQDVGRMQLVREQQHKLSRPHTGGMAIWGGGYP